MDLAEQTLKEARSLLKEKNYRLAHEKYLWFHHHALEYRKSYRGVRLSYALIDWREVSEEYPPAKTDILSIMRSKTARLREGELNENLFQDVAAMNRYFSSHKDTLDLFIEIELQSPLFARSIAIRAKEAFHIYGDYSRLLKYTQDPLKELKRHEEIYSWGMNNADEKSSSRDPEITQNSIKAHEDMFVNATGELITIFLKNDDLRTAKIIQERALETFNSSKIKNQIPSA